MIPKFVFPPRAEYKTDPDRIHIYDNGQYFGQPKLNGSACVVHLHESGERHVWNRHGQRLSLIDYGKVELNPLHRGQGWITLCGELLNKNKKGEDGQPFNQKFCLWDILMLDGKSLEGTTTIQRVELISHLYPSKLAVELKDRTIAQTDYITQVMKLKHLMEIDKAENCFVIPSYENKFVELYEELIKVDVYEGLVLKLKTGKLQPGLNEKNNAQWQVKARKPTRNYDF